jgi:hypothetical protein
VSSQPEGEFDVVLMLDVAEHVADDEAFLRQVVEHNLAPEGLLLLAVPAWPALWTSHDVRLGHVRRYTPKSGRELCSGAGLRIVESGGLFPTLVPIRAGQMLRERFLGVTVPGLDDLAARRGQMRLLDGVLRLDRRVQRAARRVALQLPGLSWWALCRR